MQGVDEVNAVELEILTVQELIEITATDDELYKRALDGLVESTMSNMVNDARNKGALGYQAQIFKEANGKSNEGLISEFVKTFTDLGYSVESEDTELKLKGQDAKKVSVITIEWRA